MCQTGKNEVMFDGPSPPLLRKDGSAPVSIPGIAGGWSGHLDGNLEGDTHEIAVELMRISDHIIPT